MGDLKNNLKIKIMLTKFMIVTMVVALAAAEYDTFDDESEPDPRLLFANVTSGLLPVNFTIMSYGAAIVLGGTLLGLAVYFLATQAKQYRYGANQYANSRMDELNQEDEMMGMVGAALDEYENIKDDDKKNKRIFDYYDY